MKVLAVSKKVYADIEMRLATALSDHPGSLSEAIGMVDAYLDGVAVTSDDTLAMLAFRMVRVELDRAMARSARARERARLRKERAGKERAGKCVPQGALMATETPPQAIRMSRRERRALERSRKKGAIRSHGIFVGNCNSALMIPGAGRRDGPPHRGGNISRARR